MIQHQMCEQRYFEDFQLGERFLLPSRTMTDALFAAFQLASGDNHPVHYDVEYCRAHGMPPRSRARQLRSRPLPPQRAALNRW